MSEPGPNWNVGNLHLVARDEEGDPRDTSMDSPARIASRTVDLAKLERLRDTPPFKGCDDAVEVFMVLPVIHVRVRTANREQAESDLKAWLSIQLGGAHVRGFLDWSIGPDVEVI